MYFLALLKKNILLIIFFIVSFWYGYTNISGDIGNQYLLKPFMVSSLLIHYLVTAKKPNVFFTSALIFALLGDLFFNILTEEAFMFGMASFLVFNLFMLIVVADRAGEIQMSNLFLAMIPFLLLLFIVIYYLFSGAGDNKILLTIYGIALVFLCTFSLFYYIKTKSTVALYFVLGSTLFVLAGIAKAVKEYIGITLSMEIMNNVAYTLSLYCYYKAMMLKRVLLDKPDLQGEQSITY